MRLLILLSAFFSLALASCTKEAEENRQTGEVWVRIDNQSGVTLRSTTITSVEYGDIAPGTRTEYKKITDPIYSGFCNFFLEHERKSAGYGICGTPMPPPFEGGYYTFKVLPPDQDWFPLEVIQ